jgi:hypothetical protein
MKEIALRSESSPVNFAHQAFRALPSIFPFSMNSATNTQETDDVQTEIGATANAEVLQGALGAWARSASGDTAEGITSIEHGIGDFRATGSVLALPGCLARKAEALHLADRTSEALEAISEAEALAERFEQRVSFAELRRLRPGNDQDD